MSDELIKCQKCGDLFNRSEIEDTRYEFDENYSKCPDCQDGEEQEIIQKNVCEYCESQAQYIIDDRYLCENHHDDYVEHNS